MSNLGVTELLLIFLVILLVFGARRIPEIARGLGKGIREFKDATTDIKRELTITDQPPPPQISYGAQPRQQHGPNAGPAVYSAPAYTPASDPAYTPPAPMQQEVPGAPSPTQPPPPGTPPAAPPTEGQQPQS